MLLAPKGAIVYGPVRSRRLKWSLGINALPPYRKTCTFDCLYCQYGRSAPVRPGRVTSGFPSVEEVLEAIEEALGRDIPQPAYLTFSGNGEPTLHPRFPDLVDGVLRLRDRLIPEARVAILSNSSLAADRGIAEALTRLDDRIMKLDAGSQQMLDRYNRPYPGLQHEAMVEALVSLKDTTIQTLLTGGPQGNASDDALALWQESLRRIGPSCVQVYSLDRTSPTASLTKLTTEDLEVLASRLARAGISATAF